MLKKTAVALLATGLSTPLFAHDAWVEPESSRIYPIYSGHKEPSPYASAKVKEAKVFDRTGKALWSQILASDQGASLAVQGDAALLLVFFDNGYWVRENGKSRNVGRLEAPNAETASNPLKWGKTLLNWTDKVKQPVGHRIEIIPVGISQIPKAGQALKVQVLLEGKPLAGVMVENNSNETGPKTDANGMATLVLTRGQQRIAVDYDRPVTGNPNFEKEVLNASLVFRTR